MHSSENFGDMLLSELLISWARSATHGQLRLLNPSARVADLLGVKKAGWTELLGARVVILGGGGFFQRMDGPMGAAKAILKYAFPIVVAKVLGKKTAVIGIGANPMPLPFLDSVLGWTLRFSDLVLLRDPIGCAYALSLLPARMHSRVHLTSDLVFSIDESKLDAQARAWAKEQIKKMPGKRTLAIHLSEPPSEGGAYRDIAHILAEEVSRQPDVRILLLEDHPGGSNAQSRAQGEMKQLLRNVPTTIVPYPGVQRLAALLAASDAVFTTKLHVGLCSVAMGTPAFSVAKHKKNLVTFDDIGLSANCCMLNETSPDVLRRIIGDFAVATVRFEVPMLVRERALMARDQLCFFLKRDAKLSAQKFI